MKITTENLKDVLKSLSEDGDFSNSQILNEESKSGVKIPSSHLTKIRKWTRSEISTDLIHTFPVIMIDTAPTRNMVLYTEVSQKKSLKGWLGRTVLFNWNGSGNVGFLGQADHSLQASSQTARIYDTRMVKTPDEEIGTLGWIYAVEGVDPIIDSFINKLNAGVLREVSIHVAVPEGVVCSIDEKPFASWMQKYDNKPEDEEKFCFEHTPGEKYGKKICYMSTGEGKLDPLELSVVAVPGSVNAHVLKPDEVEDYQLVSLKEALGGSKQIKESIMAVKNSKNKIGSVEALEEIANIAKNAGFLSERVPGKLGSNEEKKSNVTDDDDDDDKGKKKEESKCEKCGHESHEGSCSANCNSCKEKESAESLKEKKDKEEEEKKKKEEEENKNKEKEKESDPPEGDDDTKKNKKNEEEESVHLFEENCPACGGGTKVQPLTESETIDKLKSAFKEQVEIIISAAKEKISAEKKKSKENAEKAGQYDEIFDLFVQETATLAVQKGFKKSQERDNYINNLKSLSFKAVREIRETLSLNNNSREEKVEELRQSMMERAKANLGTSIEETKDGKKKASTGISRRPLFGLK